MSSSSPSPAAAQIELGARVASIELSVVGADFKPWATGVGRLSVTVPAGIYMIVARAGPVVERRLIQLDPGATFSDADIVVGFPAPAPVDHTTTSHEYHQQAAEQASHDLDAQTGPNSGLVMVVRDVRGMSGPPLTPADLGGFGLVDRELLRVPEFEQGWRVLEHEAIATWSGRLEPGGYALHVNRNGFTGPDRPPPVGLFVDQAIWLSPNWQTIVFITTGSTGPQVSAASIHMAQMGIGWSPYEADVGLALELANWGLREGRSVVPDDLLGVLLNTKFVNPMLGLLGAHSLLMRSKPDFDLLDLVLFNLENMLPASPDVVALRVMAAARRSSAAPPPSAPVTSAAAPGPMPPPVPVPPGLPANTGGLDWPPMLLPGYRAMVALDAINPGALVDGSPAERAAANLLVQGIWTSWEKLSPADAVPPADAAQPGLAAGAMATLPTLGRQPGLIERIPGDDPATARVLTYLGAVAALEGQDRRVERFDTMSSQQIGLATTLPSASVDRALANIARFMPPPPGGGSTGPPTQTRPPPPLPPPPGHSLLPILVIGAVLLLGAGAVAVCAGSTDCQRMLGFGEPTPAPTPTPTPERTRRPGPTPTPPQPVILEVPGGLEFGTATVGGNRGERELVVVSSTDDPIAISFVDDVSGVFGADESSCVPEPIDDQTLGCAMTVTFVPLEATDYEGLLQVIDPATGDLHDVRLIGRGEPLIVRLKSPIDFGSVFVDDSDTQEFSALAEEQVPLELQVTDGPPDAFTVDPSCDWVPREGDLFDCRFAITFSPHERGQQSATLVVLAAGIPSTEAVLTGFGDFIDLRGVPNG